MAKKAKKTPKQLEREIQRLILQRFGKGSFLLMMADGLSGDANYLTNDDTFFFNYGSIMFGEFCKIQIEEINNAEQSE